MNWLQTTRGLLRTLFRKRKLDEEMDDELRSHVEMQTQENFEAGMKPEEARYAALRQFGCIESVKEVCREQRGLPWLEDLAQDIRYGARGLRKNLGFTATAVLTLALGIGATTTLFCWLNALLFRPLPFPQPQSLLLLSEVWTEKGWGRSGVSLATFDDWRQQSLSFESIGAFVQTPLRLQFKTVVQTVQGAEISAGLLNVLKVYPALGRDFLPEESQPGKNQVILLSHELWKQKFAGRLDIINSQVEVDGLPYTVVGVMPEGFRFPDHTGMWRPLIRTAQRLSQRGNRCLSVIARLRPDVHFIQAQAELSTISARIGKAFSETNQGWGCSVESLRVLFTGGDIRKTLSALFLATIFVLLTACANVSNLLLARFENRKKEMAVRSSLGAGQGRIVRHVLTEGLLLAALGTVAGLVLAFWLSSAMGTLLPVQVLAGTRPEFDARVLLFASALCLVCSLCVATIPAWQLARCDPGMMLKGPTASSLPMPWRRWAGYWIALEVGCATTLLIGSGLMIRTVANLSRVDLGFDPAPLVMAEIEPIWSLNEPEYSPRKVDYFQRLQEQLARTPGVSTAAILRDDGWADFRAESGSDAIKGYMVGCSSNLFNTMSVPFIKGRGFIDRWQRGNPYEAVVNETFARRFWPAQDPIGRRFKTADAPPGTMWCTVVGVARDFKLSREQSDRPAIFTSYRSSYLQDVRLLVRITRPPADAVAIVRQIVRGFDPDLTDSRSRTMTEALAEVIGPRDQVLWLLIGFAGVSLALASVGVYGVLAYLVSQRKKEVGIRLALGATRGEVRFLMLKQAMLSVLVGVFAGVLGSTALGHLLANQMFSVKNLDPGSLLSGVALVLLISLLACLVPSFRATRVDPMTALRYE
jgi:predicted permease